MISRWEPTSQICSCCGFLGGKLDLSIREWECFNCGAKHGRVGSGRSIETKMQQEIY
ncbi:MAG: transposase [Trichodesmium sp. MAG_R03]|nr:transposase [Trichodesmium sp. MAG_R03]